ncbi:MAG TPA: ATP-binding protein [Thermoanaerobaculaceae bacterium]|nr:ATP-binding protein [Thermoanaerobaculaceae bacterium]
MVQFDNQYRQVKLKIVYYGPSLCGKTTCLQYIHRVTDPQRRTKLYTLNTASDRTLFFDLLGLDLGRVRGYRLTLQLYTVPGQVQYDTTRRAVLAGCDGVMFVADSQRSYAKANVESLANLADNLRANGLDPETVPLVLAYNKRDLPDLLARAELEKALNPRGVPVFETVATSGIGVMEAFAAVTQATVVSVGDRLGLSTQPDALTRLVANVTAALQPLVRRGAPPEAESTVVLRPEAKGENLRAEELVAEAVRANLAMTDLNVRLDQLSGELERRVANLHSINEFGTLMSLAREPEEITQGFLDRLLAELRVACGSLFLVDASGALVEVVRRGIAADPLAHRDDSGQSPAEVILASRQPLSTRLDEIEPAQVLNAPWMDEVRALNFVGALAVPLIAQDRPLGLVTAFSDASRGAFQDVELELASALGANAATALANARAWRSLEQLNRSLEGAVADRTRELQEALSRAQSLAEQLEEKNIALQTANRELTDLERLKSELLDRIAHELNTPVTAIQTAGRILTRYDEVPPERAVKFVEIITQEATRLAELIASSLQAAVLGVPEGRPAPTALAVADLLKRVLAPLKGEIANRRLAVQVKVAAGLDEVVGDADQLEAALRAVVRNAVEFNREGGSAVVTVRPVRRGTATFVEFRVEDTGVGIPEAELPHACEVFWQGGNVLTGKPRGLGLGLAVAKRVAENHGGQIEISSEEGKGTVVGLLIPAAGTRTP